jgi:hypothetical protein
MIQNPTGDTGATMKNAEGMCSRIRTKCRTVFAVFVFTSTLYTVARGETSNPDALLSIQELDLSLPCDEDIYSAPSASAWKTLNMIPSPMPKFEKAFNSFIRSQAPKSSFSCGRFSMFGALVIIAALNLEIFRQTVNNTNECRKDLSVLHSKFEPALKAWEFCWRSHPHASLSATESPFGPLPADSVPLLNLAYVKLFAETSTTLAFNEPIGDVFPYVRPDTGGLDNIHNRIQVLKGVGYAINSLFLSEWFIGVMGQSSVAAAPCTPKRNWSIVAAVAALESAVVVGTWLDRILKFKTPVKDPEAKFLNRMDHVFPSSGMKRNGSEGRRVMDVWGVLGNDQVLHSLPRIPQIPPCLS